MDWSDFDAALFDLDGVITPTAEVHMHAWAEMFSAFLAEQGIAEPYTDDDYFTYVDGKPRYDGVRSFLAVARHRAARGRSRRTVPTRRPSAGSATARTTMFEEVLADATASRPIPGSRRARRGAGRARHQDGGRLQLAQRPGRAARRRT